MPPVTERHARIELETQRRARLGVPAAAGGVLFLISAIIANSVIAGLPSVGLVQGLEPALRGTSSAVSPRAQEVRYLSHHAFGLIAGGVLAAIATIALIFVLLFLLDCGRARGLEAPSLAGPLVIAGGIGFALFGLAAQIVHAIRAHDFAGGHDFSEAAVEHALTRGAANVIVGYLGLLAPLVLMIGMIMVLIAATRAGLITRWLRGLGIGAAVVLLPFFQAIFYLELIPAAWMVSIAFLLMGKLPGGDPPAWTSGEARPWPTPAEMRAAKAAAAGQPATAGVARDVAPEPARPVQQGTSRKRRKRK
jgi:hypothetical protein